MNIVVFENTDQLAKACACIFAHQLLTKPNSVLGFATGSSPIKSYEEMVKLFRDGVIDFKEAVSFNLDEYIGVSEESPVSYHYFMHDMLFRHVNLKKTHVPNGLDKDMEKSCREYDALIASFGGIDLQLLGIGRNGHIGFNEPDSIFSAGTQVVQLTKSTIEANTRFFDKEEDVPKTAISMGVKNIFKARKIVLVANGEDKKEAIFNTVKGEIDPKVPASILQLHPDCTLLLDKAAAALL